MADEVLREQDRTGTEIDRAILEIEASLHPPPERVPKKRGRRTWLRRLAEQEPGYLVMLIERLELQPALVSGAQLRLLLRMSAMTFHRFMRRSHRGVRIQPVEDPVRRDGQGHVRVGGNVRYYDPARVSLVFRDALNSAGIDPGKLPPHEERFREAPAKRFHAPRQNNGWLQRADLAELLDHAATQGQWLTTGETAAWLGVTSATLYNWRRRLDETGDRRTYPPYYQGPDLVPSSARDPNTGLEVPRRGSDRLRHGSFRRRYDPVLYDRNQVVLWLKSYLQAH